MGTTMHQRLSIPRGAALLLLALAVSAGCRTRPGGPDRTVTLPPPPVWQDLAAGRVVSVNPEYQFVVFRWTIAPEPGEIARLYRAATEVAAVRVAPERRGQYATAEWVRGEPQVDDLVKLRRPLRPAGPDAMQETRP
ncbi:MAG: hypothetical protein K9N49_06810 [Candidatus Marinimicrobia bacterium]|nr:hypothetical protein [Candidatus Neomarinimicrobiota bacterium]